MSHRRSAHQPLYGTRAHAARASTPPGRMVPYHAPPQETVYVLGTYRIHTANSVPGTAEGRAEMLPFIFAVKKPQDLRDHVPCTCRVSVRFEAIAELPRAMVKRRPRPMKYGDTPIA